MDGEYFHTGDLSDLVRICKQNYILTKHLFQNNNYDDDEDDYKKITFIQIKNKNAFLANKQ